MATHINEIITTGVEGYILPPEQKEDANGFTITMTPQEGYEIDGDNLPIISVKGKDPDGYANNFSGRFTNNTNNVSYTINSSKYKNLYYATITITGSAKKKEEEVIHISDIVTTGVSGYTLPPEQTTDDSNFTITMTPIEGYEVDGENLPTITVEGEDTDGFDVNISGTFTNNNDHVSWSCALSLYNMWDSVVVTIEGTAKKKEVVVTRISEIVTTGVEGYILPPEQTTDDTNFTISMTPQEGYEVDGEKLPTIHVTGKTSNGFPLDVSGTFTNNTTNVSWSYSANQYDKWRNATVTITGNAKKKEDTPTPPTPPTPTKGTLYGIINVYKPSSDNMNELASKQIVASTGSSQTLVNLNEYIVDYFKLFATVPTTKKDTIKMYEYDTKIESDVVECETISIDCGSVTIEETHMNSLDYEKTTVEVFLPFIGLKTLDTVKVMGNTIKLLYKISVLTGDCVAMLIDSNNIMFETFEGNMSFKVPRMVSDKFHDKTLNDNSNYLLGLTPYVIIRTPIEYATSDLNKNHVRDKIGTFTEYNEFSNFRLDNISCTATEKEEIKRLLQEGIIL